MNAPKRNIFGMDKNWNEKLSKIEKEKIKSLRLEGYSAKALADKFKVSLCHIYRILKS